MRLNDILLERSENKFEITHEIKGGKIIIMAISRDEKEENVATLTLEGNAIIKIEAKEDISGYRDAIFEALRYLCDKADSENQILTIPDESLSASQRRHFEQFGFMMGKDKIRERRAGASLPITFI